MFLPQTAGRTMRAVTVLAALVFTISAVAAQPDDKLGVPGPIVFAGNAYLLAWSAQPSASYIKQEYLPAGEQPTSFSNMISLELLTSGADVGSALSAQVQMLNQRKQSDPLVNFEILEHPESGEVILDFILSDESTGVTIIEWSAYRYLPVALPGGGSGIALMAISRRGYGDGAEQFLSNLKASRLDDIRALATYQVPEFQ